MGKEGRRQRQKQKDGRHKIMETQEIADIRSLVVLEEMPEANLGAW